jgi:hypothetical protein
VAEKRSERNQVALRVGTARPARVRAILQLRPATSFTRMSENTSPGGVIYTPQDQRVGPGLLTLGLGILIAWLPLGIITVWFIYRIIRGWGALTERRPTYA